MFIAPIYSIDKAECVDLKPGFWSGCLGSSVSITDLKDGDQLLIVQIGYIGDLRTVIVKAVFYNDLRRVTVCRDFKILWLIPIGAASIWTLPSEDQRLTALQEPLQQEFRILVNLGLSRLTVIVARVVVFTMGKVSYADGAFTQYEVLVAFWADVVLLLAGDRWIDVCAGLFI